MLKRFNDGLEKVLTTVGVGFFIVFISVVFLQVLSRNYLRISMMWIQEVALFCFLWSVFIGGSIAVRRKRHYLVELFPEKYERINWVLDIIGDLSVFVMVYVFLPYGYQFMMLGLNRYSRILSLPQAYFFAVFPFAAVCMLLFGIEILWRDLRRFSR